MRNVLLALVMLSGAMMFSTASANAAVTTGDVRMRAGPGTQFAIITTLSRGTGVNILECLPQPWCRVQWGRRIGWVSANYLAGGAAAPRRYVPQYYSVPQYAYPPSVILQFGPRYRHYHHRRHHDWRPRHHRPGWQRRYGGDLSGPSYRPRRHW